MDLGSLPDVVLREIFEWLLADESKTAAGTLHACVLTNRRWSTNAVPVLWRAPFRRCSARVIEVMILELTEEERRPLAAIGILHAIQKCLEDCGPSSTVSLPALLSRQRTSNYMRFLRDLDYWVLLASIRAFLKQYGNDLFPALLKSIPRNDPEAFHAATWQQRQCLVTVLLRAFVNRRISLSKLRVPTWDDTLNAEDYLLLLKPPFHPLLATVRDLHIGSGHRKDEFLLRLGQVCRRVVNANLILANWDAKEDNGRAEMRALAALISGQTQLAGLKLWLFRDYGANVNYVLDAFRSQARSLRALHLSEVNLTATHGLGNVAACTRLETFGLACCELDAGTVAPLIRARFPRLEKVDVQKCHDAELNRWASMVNRSCRGCAGEQLGGRPTRWNAN